MTDRQRTTPSRPRFEVYQDKKSEWRWRLVSRNGRVVADSGEGYKTKSNAVRAVDTMEGVFLSASGKNIYTAVLVDDYETEGRKNTVPFGCARVKKEGPKISIKDSGNR